MGGVTPSEPNDVFSEISDGVKPAEQDEGPGEGEKLEADSEEEGDCTPDVNEEEYGE